MDDTAVPSGDHVQMLPLLQDRGVIQGVCSGGRLEMLQLRLLAG